MELYSRRLYGYFLRSSGNHHDAEDMLSELTVRLVRNLPGYDDRGRFDAWLFRVSANIARDRIRRQKVRGSEISLAGLDDDDPGLQARLTADDVSAATVFEQAQARRRLAEVIGQLDHDTRQMILLRHFGQLSFREIAQQLGCPLGTVLARVHRGLRRLRKMMGEEYDPRR